MHTVDELDATDFMYVSDGQVVQKKEVMPEISLANRLGVVMGHGAEGIGAGNFILACVINFYDTLKEQKDDFFEYPDFYTFQATTDPADYGMFDIFPAHKNVVIDTDAESILRAVNDRAIDILLVPNVSQRSSEIADITRRSAERRIESCFCYSPEGQIDDHSFAIKAPRQPIEEWFKTISQSMATSSNHERWQPGQHSTQCISQEFRRVPLDRALISLRPNDDTNPLIT